MAKRKPRFNEKQLAAIAILSLPDRGGLTYKQVAERVGVSEQALHNWRKRDDFNEEIKKQVLRNAVDDLPNIFKSIPKHIIEDGNAAMFRTFLQSLGMLTEKVEVNNTTDTEADLDRIKAEIMARKKKDN